MLQNKKIALYITGSIAAYKSLSLVRLLVGSQAQVRVVMTAGAQEFVTPLSFQTLSKNQVLTDTFSAQRPEVVDHIELADWSDLAIVAPASANLIAKMAQGLADDFASLTLLATTAPKLIAPAMNSHMWANAAVQRNLKTLKADGIQVIEPDVGFLAEGYQGKGRMVEPQRLLAAIDAQLPAGSTLVNKKVVVTAGATHERIDPVRFIANDSSGKMGYAIAHTLQQRGANVTLISGPTHLSVPLGVHLVSVISTSELQQAVVKHFKKSDILVMAAAVADFKPLQTAAQKIKKSPNNNRWQLELEKTPDILKTVAQIKQPQQITVGFAAETQNLVANATKKLTTKNLDLVVANDVSQPGVGFNGDTNQVTFIKTQQPPLTTALLPKSEIAEQLADQIEQLI
ncbi:bifunctional phosphopantothenoylcysteine decarboxylase/phosphopantothenate--cysteine ligase CoaBC [Bombilactobacillus bombi]|uniref:bifunctional phosphopantothenoylcysteine decarboxylase/phosphopantothenate--cysteine ligase CoaBC n=1 Tax=Bombilactobacillus bombi TaxID=1303590 RepID=UPI0015E61F03|nr:bifunctional phosphopantothenoylcysteine decarboxylase/phosphopantothenate--cysteine ligase CoaBC [Bombilactobacillus bombi]MBA1433646.1 bifunctional phosphopantothenoylcysteine decarboxylase/phosphopantothenate--cysteine ligase CoaBC [Bombilactobacillus bombi]